MRGRANLRGELLEKVNMLMLCRAWHCKPSELDQEEHEYLILGYSLYNEINKKNPATMFM